MITLRSNRLLRKAEVNAFDNKGTVVSSQGFQLHTPAEVHDYVRSKLPLVITVIEMCPVDLSAYNRNIYALMLCDPDGITGASNHAPIKKAVCGCGVKHTGGKHSNWCDVAKAGP